jgi:hypothetical protein
LADVELIDIDGDQAMAAQRDLKRSAELTRGSSDQNFHVLFT